jgi:hypothetical protein
MQSQLFITDRTIILDQDTEFARLSDHKIILHNYNRTFISVTYYNTSSKGISIDAVFFVVLSSSEKLAHQLSRPHCPASGSAVWSSSGGYNGVVECQLPLCCR